jgi:hypothetical protein
MNGSSNDPTIQAADPSGCLYIYQNPASLAQWWLNPNLVMAGSDSGLVIPGSANTTNITVSWKSECALEQDDANALLDLYITNSGPSMTLEPGSTGLTTVAAQQLALTAVSPPQFLAPGDLNQLNSVGPWDPAGQIPAIAHGHECLLARIYPNTFTFPLPENISSYPAVDSHYAQRNVWVGPSEGKFFKLGIGNGTLLREPQLVAIQAVPDVNPNPIVLAAVLPGLQALPGFKQISTTPLRSVGLNVSAFRSEHESLLERILQWIEHVVLEVIRDLEHKAAQAGGTSVRVVLPPNFFAKFDFTADLAGATPGNGYIYHLTQVNGMGRPCGGLTVGILAT